MQPLALKGDSAFAEMWDRISVSPEEAVFPTMETGLQMIQDNQDVLYVDFAILNAALKVIFFRLKDV